MNVKRKLTALLLLLALLLSLTACGDAVQTIDTIQQAAQTVQEIAAAQEEETPAIEEDGTYTTKEDVVRYIHTYGHLPENFITKKQAQALGWEGGSLEPYAPASASAAAASETTRELSPRRTAGPTPSATLTRWEQASAGVSALFSPTTDSAITRRTTMRRLSLSMGRNRNGRHS